VTLLFFNKQNLIVDVTLSFQIFEYLIDSCLLKIMKKLNKYPYPKKLEDKSGNKRRA